MLKLPTNAGEWGFVIVLSVLFCGLAFGVIYSQLELHSMRRAQAVGDTEIQLRLLADRVRRYHKDHGRVEDTLTAMNVGGDALETRNAVVDPAVGHSGGKFTLHAELKKFGHATCTLTFDADDADQQATWSG